MYKYMNLDVNNVVIYNKIYSHTTPMSLMDSHQIINDIVPLIRQSTIH